MAKILVLHGPNLNMLGIREPGHYGQQSLNEINAHLLQIANKNEYQLEYFQNNSESILIEKIHQAYEKFDFIIINPAAFTHTSVAMRDALSAVQIPFVECHISNVYAREPFRHKSYFSDIAIGVISGLGTMGYELALSYAMDYLKNNS